MYAIQPSLFRTLIVRPALAAIGLGGDAAEELVLGTALQESGLRLIHQLGDGPALGWFQMEPATHEWLHGNIVPRHPSVLDGLPMLVIRGASPVDQLVGNAWYGAAMCRLRYLADPAPLPAAGDLAGQAAFWKRVYNTVFGAGTVSEYLASWRAAFPLPQATSQAGAAS